MDFDPSVALHAQQRFVVSHAAGLLLVEGPTRSGRTFALLARAHRLISAETGDAEDIRQRDGLGAGLALRAVFVAPSRHEANAAAECLAMETGGYRPLAFGVADIASELLASELAESGPTARRIVARSTWQRVTGRWRTPALCEVLEGL